jgi:hypothetical protein
MILIASLDASHQCDRIICWMIRGGWWLCPGSFWSLRSFRLVNWGWCCVFYRSKIACTCGFWFATAWNWRWMRPSSSSARCSGWASSNKSRDVQRRDGLSSFSRYVQTHHDGVSFWNFSWSFCDDAQVPEWRGVVLHLTCSTYQGGTVRILHLLTGESILWSVDREEDSWSCSLLL